MLVVGVSGGGKSSLVRAGVLPLLVQPGVIEGVGLWRRAILKPSDSGGDLLQALAAALLAPNSLPELGSDGTTVEQLAELLRQSPAAAFPLIKGGLSQAAAALAQEQALPKQPEARLVVVADQLEELFTLPNVTPADRISFLAALSALARCGKVWIIATLRGDLYHRSFELAELVALQEGHGQYALPLPTAAEVGQMIRQPARAAGLRFEEDPQTKITLDEVLREAASANPESLPLLEFALEELYQHKNADGLLTYAAYNELGGLEGAIRQRAESVVETLPPDVQGALPRLFRVLVHVSPEESAAEDVTARRPAPLKPLYADELLSRLVRALVDGRLLTTDQLGDGTPVVRLAHEALLRHWPRLGNWLTENREWLRVRSRVKFAAKRWVQERRGSDLLLGRGKPLDEAVGLLSTVEFDLSSDAREFIAASMAKERRRRVRRRAVMVILAWLSLISGTLGILAWRSRNEAVEQKNAADVQKERAERGEVQADRAQAVAEKNWDVAEKQRKVAEKRLSELARACFETSIQECQRDNFHTAVNWMLRAIEVAPEDDKLRPIYRRFLAAQGSNLEIPLLHKGTVHHVAFSPDGQRVLTVSDDAARIWDADTGKVLVTLGHKSSVRSAVFSPDGRQVLTGSDDSAHLWDAATGKLLATLKHEKKVRTVAFSPKGSQVLTISDDLVRIWNLANGKPLATLRHKSFVGSAVFSPDGRQLLTSGRHDPPRLWDAATGALVATLEQDKSEWNDGFFSPDSRKVFTVGAGRACLWDAATGKLVATLKHDGKVSAGASAFSPDSRKLLTGSEDHTARLWDTFTGKHLATLKHDEQVSAVAFSSDGRRVVTGSFDFRARLWDAATGELLGAPKLNGPVMIVAFRPDSEHLITCSLNTWYLWDAFSGKSLATIEHGGRVTAASFSRDGQRVITSSDDGTARIMALATRKSLKVNPQDSPPEAVGVAFSPAGRELLAVSWGKTTLLWDATTVKLVATLENDNSVRCVALSSDGRKVLTGNEKGIAQTWDAATGKPLMTINEGIIEAAALSPDGRQVLTAAGRIARTWDAATGERLRMIRHGGNISAVAFSPDSRQLITAGAGSVCLWDAVTGTLLATIKCDGSKTSITAVALSPDGRQLFAGRELETAILWDVATGKPLKNLKHGLMVDAAVFNSDGRKVLTHSKSCGACPLDVAFTPLPDDPERLRAWVYVMTRRKFDEDGQLQVLTAEEWFQWRKKLDQAGEVETPRTAGEN